MMSRLLLKKYIPRFQMARHLVTDPKYGFLKQLGITIENPGLYDGKWGGSGKVPYVDLLYRIRSYHRILITNRYIMEVGEGLT